MFKDFLVSTPDEKGKITTQTRKTQAGKTVYILYEIGRTYNAAKKYNVPHRVVIGKADPNDPEKMYPNEKYFEHFPQTVDKVEPTEESRSAPQHRSPHRGRPVPQLPRRTGRHHQALQAR